MVNFILKFVSVSVLSSLRVFCVLSAHYCGHSVVVLETCFQISKFLVLLTAVTQPRSPSPMEGAVFVSRGCQMLLPKPQRKSLSVKQHPEDNTQQAVQCHAD